MVGANVGANAILSGNPIITRSWAEPFGNNAAFIRFDQDARSTSSRRPKGAMIVLKGPEAALRATGGWCANARDVIDRDEMVEAPRVVGEIQHGGAKWNPEPAIIQHSAR